jgi:predicted nucleotidyltransferase
MKKTDKLRLMIAQEAARIMYEEKIPEYRDAKRKAAKRFGSVESLSLGSHLPSNAEIHRELQLLIGMFEEKVLPERLMFLRILALRYMELFAPFLPHLVGSVLTGVVTHQSDIDLHLFAESPEEVEQFLLEREIPFESEVVSIRKGAQFFEYPHIYLEEDEVIIDCTVYPPEERRKRSISSITGKAMERADTKKLRRIVGEML